MTPGLPLCASTKWSLSLAILKLRMLLIIFIELVVSLGFSGQGRRQLIFKKRLYKPSKPNWLNRPRDGTKPIKRNRLKNDKRNWTRPAWTLMCSRRPPNSKTASHSVCVEHWIQKCQKRGRSIREGISSTNMRACYTILLTQWGSLIPRRGLITPITLKSA